MRSLEEGRHWRAADRETCIHFMAVACERTLAGTDDATGEASKAPGPAAHHGSGLACLGSPVLSTVMQTVNST